MAASPIIAYDGEPAPPYSMGQATSSTAPGARMPHFWIDEAAGISIYDRLGPDYALLVFDQTHDLAPFLSAFSAADVPIKVLPAERPDEDAFRHALLVVRQDQHVVWRADRAPQPQDIAARLRGPRASWRARSTTGASFLKLTAPPADMALGNPICCYAATT